LYPIDGDWFAKAAICCIILCLQHSLLLEALFTEPFAAVFVCGNLSVNRCRVGHYYVLALLDNLKKIRFGGDMSRWQKANGSAKVALILAVLIALPICMSAQDEAVPKGDVFVGYQWLNVGGDVARLDANGNVITVRGPSLPAGFGVAGAYNFNRWLAGEADYGINWGHSMNEQEASIGPRLMYRAEGVDFFIHTLLSLNYMGVKDNRGNYGVGTVLGGGMDLKVTHQFKFRLFEADFVGAHHGFGSIVPETYPDLRRHDFDGVRLRTGFVFTFGGEEVALTPAAACSVQNPEVMVGEPVHVTVAASNFNAKHTLSYAWSSSGGKIEGKDTGATIDTNGVAGGSYTATATVTDAKAKKNNTASCTANFTVKEPPKNPPQISCSANPTMVQAGTSSRISCTCTSPDNVPVTVGGWTSTGGSLSGSGNTATLSTAGASSGPITIRATCTDSRGLTASSSASVTIENPPPPPPQASKVNQCDYPNEKKPWRVDNTCKAMLDDVAAKLQQDPDAKLVVVGNAEEKEIKHSKRKNLAAERAVDVKYYLTEGEAKQHIDPSRIETRTGNEGTMTTEQWIIPAGASYPGAGSTTPVDEAKVKAIPDHPKPAAKKAAKKKAE
jgi:hypothetical protein